MTPQNLTAATFFLLCFFFTSPGEAATVTWAGGVGTTWGSGSSWVGGSAPTANDDAVIDSGKAISNVNQITIATSGTGNIARTLTIREGGGLEIITPANNSLNIYTGGTFTQTGGGLNLLRFNVANGSNSGGYFLKGGDVKVTSLLIGDDGRSGSMTVDETGGEVPIDVTVDVLLMGFSASSGNSWLTINSGTFKTTGNATALGFASGASHIGYYSNGSGLPSYPVVFTMNGGTFEHATENPNAGFFIGNGDGTDGTNSRTYGQFNLFGGEFINHSDVSFIVGYFGSGSSFLLDGGEYRGVGNGNVIVKATTPAADRNNGQGTTFTMHSGVFEANYLTLGGTDADSGGAAGTLATVVMTGGTMDIRQDLRVGRREKTNFTVSGGSITANKLEVDNGGFASGSSLTIVGSRSVWELGGVTTGAGAVMNFKLDSGGVSTLAAGIAALEGTFNVSLADGAVFLHESAYDLVTAYNGGLNSVPTMNLLNGFTAAATGNALRLAFDPGIAAIGAGGSEAITFAPQEKGWLKLVAGGDDPEFQISVLNAGGTWSSTAIDELLGYLNAGLAGTGYDFSLAGGEGENTVRLTTQANMLGVNGFAYFGWDFADFNMANVGIVGGGLTLTDDGSDVPEPATWVMILLGGAAMVALRSRYVRARGVSQCPSEPRS